MKNTIIAFIIILIAIFVILTFLTPDEEYKAEKMLYRASKAYSKVKINPDVAPPKLIASVENELRTIVNKYSDTNAAMAAHMALSEIYMSNKRYKEALLVLDEIIEKYNKEEDLALLSKARFLKGLAYKELDRWDLALKEFAILKDECVNTPLGLQAPMYVARYYVEQGKATEADAEFSNAVGFYDKLRTEKKGTLLAYSASNLLVQAYIYLKRYEEAGQVVEDCIVEYPATLTFMQQIPLVESIYLTELKDPNKVMEIFNFILKNTDDEKIKTFVQSRIDTLSDEDHEAVKTYLHKGEKVQDVKVGTVIRDEGEGAKPVQ